MFRTSNPVFSQNNAFAPAQSWDDLDAQGRGSGFPTMKSPERPAAPGTMTVQGTVNKTFFLLAICVTTATFAWAQFVSDQPLVNPMILMFGGAILGLITCLVCVFAPKTSPITAPAYAAFEGLFLGGISAMYAMRFANAGPSISTSVSASGGSLNTALVFNAMLLTFGILGGLLLGYTTKIIRPGPVFKNVIVAGTLGVCVYGLIAFGASLFGSFSLASVYDPSNGGLISIGFSLLLVALASGNLVLDFDFIHDGVRNRAPRYMEWYGAFGLMVSLVWLYIEVLRLLAKLRRE